MKKTEEMENKKNKIKELKIALCLLPVTIALIVLNVILCQHVFLKIGIELTFWKTFFALGLIRCLLGITRKVDKDEKTLHFLYMCIGEQAFSLILALISYFIIF